MTHGSLFSGIGGFDLAAEWAGWQNVFHCELNPFSQKVLKFHFPQSISYENIITTDFSIHKGAIDIISGGFPCQPYSSAGKRLGTADNRHLWPQMLRAIREIQPSWVVGENVRGLTNWNGGVVFDQVQIDLEIEGYEVTPFLLPACAVNAPHRRDRIWFVAYSQNNGRNQHGQGTNKRQINQFQDRTLLRNKSTTNGKESNATNTMRNGQQQYKYEINASKRGEHAFSNTQQMGEYDTNPSSFGLEGSAKTEQIQVTTNNAKTKRSKSALSFKANDNGYKSNWKDFPTESPICGGNDGLPKELDNITFSKWRQESIKAYGNAIVPKVAYQIFETINKYNKNEKL
jgi:DNA (cytosine-5)-methyltransferase 1